MKAEHLLKLAATYVDHTGYQLTTVGAYAVNDGKFFQRIEAGGSCTLRTAGRVVCWFSDHWPADLAWPADIPRPAQSKKEAA